ncbi:DUF7510 family protein [Halobaculum gomorrense]|uniref:Uncharacterized protein n=1 Tax=Halobaculum gomorrense TaxID=43928 RepID=A0A1M5R1V3_9EURY|nr:hypothetical protein [Halobaculum gomorrense]SHH20056.1 hypothetical protein SAMN05443636_2013 [Halobaculum gomorrense]
MEGNAAGDEEEEHDDAAGTDRPVSVDVEIADGRTVITVTGDRDAAVVVESASGERVYLPPEDFDRPPESEDGPRQGAYGTGPGPSDSPYQSTASDSPYQSVATDSPYQSPETSDSPYQRGGPAPDRVGLEPTADGFRIVHPEPITDFRLLR